MVITSMSLNNDELHSNIKRQAKRLSKILSIPLGRAQESLSINVYDSESWGHLLSSLKSQSFDDECLLLAALQPKADILLFKLLDNNMSSIVQRFQKKLEINENNIISLFGIEPSDFEGKIK